MDESKQLLAEKLKSSNNILVTVGRNPSVDQLSALLGLTLFLNKLGKHAAAVFSGEVPSTLEFLQPEETIEKDTNSLRDFIIALDKTKADKLRYKVEDDVVRIFITPYKTSISQDDFEFSQGDFNVDLVVTLGVQQQEDLDEAIVAHGRILHDATVSSINISSDGGIGTINWHSPDASSLSELVCELVGSIDKEKLDEQIATAILTGIVAETDRFSNEKTSANTMSASATLMAAGANQQLVASKLQEPDGGFGGVDQSNGDNPEDTGEGEKKDAGPDDGTLEISHEGDTEDKPILELPEPDADAPIETDEPESSEPDEEEISDEGAQPISGLSEGSRLITEPPTLGGTLTSNTKEEALDPSTDPLSMPSVEAPQMLSHKDSLDAGQSSLSDMPTNMDTPVPAAPSQFVPAPSPLPEPISIDTPAPSVVPDPVPSPIQPLPNPATTSEPPTPPEEPSSPYSTLADLEESIGSPHAEADTTHLDAARDEVSRALTEATATGTNTPQPIQALNAQPLGEDLHPSAPAMTPPSNQVPQVTDPTAPPPVPPPLSPFQFGNQPPKQ